MFVDSTFPPRPDCGQEYNKQLARSTSARVGGRHYATGYLHLQIPENCLVVDGIESPHVDIVVDVAHWFVHGEEVGRDGL